MKTSLMVSPDDGSMNWLPVTVGRISLPGLQRG
jgi:hypothetical protein